MSSWNLATAIMTIADKTPGDWKRTSGTFLAFVVQRAKSGGAAVVQDANLRGPAWLCRPITPDRSVTSFVRASLSWPTSRYLVNGLYNPYIIYKYRLISSHKKVKYTNLLTSYDYFQPETLIITFYPGNNIAIFSYRFFPLTALPQWNILVLVKGGRDYITP